MSGVAELRKLQRVICLGTLTLCLSFGAYAQQKSGDRTAPERNPERNRSLKFELRVLTPLACVGSPLKLRVEVTNVSQESIELNRAYFWNEYAVYPSFAEGEVKDTEYFISHVWPVSTSEDIVTLGPGKTYISHRYWSLDENAKLAPGNYTLQIKTNQVKFLLHDCEADRLRSNNEYRR